MELSRKIEDDLIQAELSRASMLAVQLADAQATITALQAQHKLARDAWWESVKELEAQLTQRTAQLTQLDRTLADVYAQRDGLQKDLAQRTAGLEAAKRDRDELQSVFDLGHTRTVEADKLWQEAHGKPEVWPDLGELVGWLMKRYDDLQAELERVRGLVKTYADAKIDFDDKRLQEDHHAWRERYNKLVEAENALLQHRQGMEG